MGIKVNIIGTDGACIRSTFNSGGRLVRFGKAAAPKAPVQSNVSVGLQLTSPGDDRFFHMEARGEGNFLYSVHVKPQDSPHMIGHMLSATLQCIVEDCRGTATIELDDAFLQGTALSAATVADAVCRGVRFYARRPTIIGSEQLPVEVTLALGDQTPAFMDCIVDDIIAGDSAPPAEGALPLLALAELEPIPGIGDRTSGDAARALKGSAFADGESLGRNTNTFVIGGSFGDEAPAVINHSSAGLDSILRLVANDIHPAQLDARYDAVRRDDGALIPPAIRDAFNRRQWRIFLDDLDGNRITGLKHYLPMRSLRTFAKWLAFRIGVDQDVAETLVMQRLHGALEADIIFDERGLIDGIRAQRPLYQQARGYTYDMGSKKDGPLAARHVLLMPHMTSEGSHMDVPLGYRWEGERGAAYQAFTQFYDQPAYRDARKDLISHHELSRRLFSTVDASQRILALARYLERHPQQRQLVRGHFNHFVERTGDYFERYYRANYEQARRGEEFDFLDEMRVLLVEMCMRDTLGDATVDRIIPQT